MTAMITKHGLFDIQVCVPKDWTDEQVLDFLKKEYPRQPASGWLIRRQADEWLGSDDERVQCEQEPNNCHIMLDA